MERALSPKADNVWKNSNTCQCCHHMWSLMWLRCPSPKGIKKEVFRGLVDRGVRVMVFLAKFPWKLFWAINTFEFTRDSWERLSKHCKKKKTKRGSCRRITNLSPIIQRLKGEPKPQKNWNSSSRGSPPILLWITGTFINGLSGKSSGNKTDGEPRLEFHLREHRKGKPRTSSVEGKEKSKAHGNYTHEQCKLCDQFNISNQLLTVDNACTHWRPQNQPFLT